jgi:creatinine amidohydrolase
MKPSTGDKILWSELLPFEFKRRLVKCPIVYLPLGLCEPHGQVSAFGLDTIKAEWLCQKAAHQTGGIVAPSMGYHIHETGINARWLEEMVGEENPHMTGMPPDVFLHFFLYQLRSFVNAGFRTIVVVSGHSGGNQIDIRLAADIFMKHIPVQVWVRSDPELVEGLYEGDHAGKYEISQLMYIRPDLVNMEALAHEVLPQSGGRFALGSDATEATLERGSEIMKACLNYLVVEVEHLKRNITSKPNPNPNVSYSTVELIWKELLQRSIEWITNTPWPEQEKVSSQSRWKQHENYKVGMDAKK